MSHDPATGPDLSAGLRAETAIGGRGVPVSALAEGARDPPVGSIRQDRRRLRRQGVPVGQGGHGVPVRRFGNHLDVAARACLFPARHFASSRSISTAVTRGAMRASARVVGPGPGPSSSRLSPREMAARASAGGFRASVFPLRAGAIVPMELIHSAIHRRWHPARCDASNRDVPLSRQA